MHGDLLREFFLIKVPECHSPRLMLGRDILLRILAHHLRVERYPNEMRNVTCNLLLQSTFSHDPDYQEILWVICVGYIR